jgi:hypothetical protein
MMGFIGVGSRLSIEALDSAARLGFARAERGERRRLRVTGERRILVIIRFLVELGEVCKIDKQEAAVLFECRCLLSRLRLE